MPGSGDRPLALTDLQRAIVEGPPSRLVFLAGPGAGKSLLLAERAAHLVEREAASPDRVLLLAPSRRAAAELQGRLRRRLGGRAAPRATTFHDLAFDILSRHYRELGYRRPPRLLFSSGLSLRLRRALETGRPGLWPGGAVYAGAGLVEKMAYDLVVGAAQNGLDPAELRRREAYWGTTPGTCGPVPQMADFYSAFRESLRRDGRVDREGGLAEVVGLLRRRPEVAASYRAAYPHLLVDEFEEANYPQAELLESLIGEETDLLVAGDATTAISSYQGGSPVYLRRLSERAGTRVVVARENHRAGARLAVVLRAWDATAPAAASPGGGRPASVTCYTDEGAVATGGPADLEPVELPAREDEGYAVLRRFAYPADEARWVAAEIQSLVQGGVPPARIAVLVRSVATPPARAVAAELKRRGVPHYFHRPRAALAEPLARATVDLLRYLADPAGQRAAWARVLASSLAGLPGYALAELRRAAAAADRDPVELVADPVARLWLSEPLRKALDVLGERIAALPATLDRGAAALLWEVWRTMPGWQADARAAGQASAGYRRILEEVADWEEEHGRLSLGEWLRMVDDGYFDRLGAVLGSASGVAVTTVHLAKGREWEAVFLPGLVEDVYPLRPSPMDVMAPLLARDLPAGRSGAGGAEATELYLAGHLEEERRVFRAAISRARRALYLSYSHWGADGTSTQTRSRFLAPVVGQPGEAGSGPPALEVIEGDGEERLPGDPEGAARHYRRLLGAGDPLARARGVYALHRLREIAPEAVRPETWWDGIEETRGAAPSVAGGPLYLSASRLNVYRDCPLAYQFSYHWRLGEPEGAALTIGSVLHKVLEKYHQPGSPLPRTRDGLQQLLDAEFKPDAFRYPAIARQARKNLERMLDLYYGRYGETRSALVVERPFRFFLNRHVVFTGYIDRVDRLDAGELELIDYKTGSPMAKAEAESDLQLALYDLAFYADRDLGELGRPARVSYLYLKAIGPRGDGKRSYVPDDASRHRLRSRIAFYAEAIRAERFPSRFALAAALPDLDPAELERALRTDGCRFCSYRWICPEWDKGGDGG